MITRNPSSQIFCTMIHESLKVLDSPVLLLAGQATHGVVVEAGGQKLNVVTMLVSTS